MVKKYIMTARPVSEPITEPVTKLGGQPVWLDEPCWPLSKALGEPMGFIGQFVIYPEIFGETEARMAYLFMTDTFANVTTWEPNAGENAVVLQPGEWDGPTAPLREGPTLNERIFDSNHRFVEQVSREYAVDLQPGDDPDTLEESEDVDESKIGGTPAYLQSPEYPDAGVWRLLAQIDAAIVPTGPNFGDAGIGYAFLSEDGKTARFLWQCA